MRYDNRNKFVVLADTFFRTPKRGSRGAKGGNTWLYSLRGGHCADPDSRVLVRHTPQENAENGGGRGSAIHRCQGREDFPPDSQLSIAAAGA